RAPPRRLRALRLALRHRNDSARQLRAARRARTTSGVRPARRSEPARRRIRMTAGIERWLLQQGRRSADTGAMLEGLATRLVELGRPRARLGIHMRAPHPQVAGLRVLWTPDRPIEEPLYGHETPLSDAFVRSPPAACYHTAHPIPRRLEGPEAAFDY